MACTAVPGADSTVQDASAAVHWLAAMEGHLHTVPAGHHAAGQLGAGQQPAVDQIGHLGAANIPFCGGQAVAGRAVRCCKGTVRRALRQHQLQGIPALC